LGEARASEALPRPFLQSLQIRLQGNECGMLRAAPIIFGKSGVYCPFEKRASWQHNDAFLWMHPECLFYIN
jgi:hypothetical protein